MDEVSEGLCARSSLVKVGSLPAEGVGRNHRLGLEAVSANWTTQFDLPQRRHSPLASLLFHARGNFCARYKFNQRSSSLLLKKFSQRIFSHPSSALRSISQHEPGC
jgi:hypothetical protein